MTPQPYITDIDAECNIYYSDGKMKPCEYQPNGSIYQECGPGYGSHGHCPKWNFRNNQRFFLISEAEVRFCESQTLDMESVRSRPAPSTPNLSCFGNYERDPCVSPSCPIKVKCREYTEGVATIRNETLGEAILKFEEVKSGIDTYEKEHEHQQFRDDCLGIYIPSNIVRRLIDVRIESLRREVPE